MASIRELLFEAEALGVLRFEAEVLLAKVLQEDRAYLMTWPEKKITDDLENHYRLWLVRRAAGEPIAYILGTKEFWSLPIFVDPSTLIPRFDTECWLAWLFKEYESHSKLDILELGSGSGAIALAIAHEKPQWSICAVEQSAEALVLAKKNAEMLSCPQIEWLQSDWYQAVSGRCFDLILANPPYIAEEDPHWRQGDLRFEPKQALVSADAGLRDLTHIIEQAPQYLRAEGTLLVEHGFEQGCAVSDLLKGAGFKDVKTYNDYAEKPRWSVGRLV